MFKDVFYRRVAVLSAVVLSILTVSVLTPILVPFVVALILAYLTNPLVKAQIAIKIPKTLAILNVFFGVILLCVMAIAYLIPVLWEQFGIIKQNTPKFLEWLNNDARLWLIYVTEYDIPSFDVNEISQTILQYLQTSYNFQDAGALVTKLSAHLINAMSSVGLFFLIPVIVFFLLVDWDKKVNHVVNAIPPRYREQVQSVGQECHVVLMSFIKGQAMVIFILGLIYAIGLQFAVGLNTGIMIGFVAGIASVIPYLGVVIGLVLAVVSTIIQFGVDVHLVYVLAVFVIGQFIEGNILQTLLIGDRIGLSPAVVMFVVIVGGSLFGMTGMLLALPTAAVALVLLKHGYARYKRTEFYLGTSPTTEEPLTAEVVNHHEVQTDIDNTHKSDVNVAENDTGVTQACTETSNTRIRYIQADLFGEKSENETTESTEK